MWPAWPIDEWYSTSHLCPIRPLSQAEGQVVGSIDDTAYEKPEDAPFGIDLQDVDGSADVAEDVDADSGDVTVRSRALPTPLMPSAAVVAQLTSRTVPGARSV